MGNVYIGVNNIAKKVSNIYVGVSNIAKKVSKVYVGVNNIARLVYTNGSGVDPTKSSFTEAEVNALAVYKQLGEVNVGATVTLANSYDTNRSTHTYVIIGKNHDSTTNTADLWTTGCINLQKFSSKSPWGRWSDSDIRTYGNSTYKNGFSSITQSHMRQMTVKTYFGGSSMAAPNDTTTDYIKLLSVKEFNVSSYDNYTNRQEGNAYSSYFPYLGYDDTSDNAKKRYASTTGTADTNYQFTRSCYTYHGGGGYLQAVSLLGNITQGYCTDTLGFCPCFRLGA